MKRLIPAFAAALILFGASALAADKQVAAPPVYEPLKAWAPFSGKTFRGEWSDPDGTKVVDIAQWRLILNGRALQSTHRIDGTDYGGRSIFFFDEGAKEYVYHYFTTAGFHTQGKANLVEGGIVTEEKVEGHKTIGSVRSKVTFGDDNILVEVVYVGKDGSETAGGQRTYRPIDHKERLFPDTE